MSVTFASLGLQRLNLEERLELVGQLWDEIVADAPPGALLSQAQRDELQRRAGDAAAHPEDYVTWEETLAAARKRLSP